MKDFNTKENLYKSTSNYRQRSPFIPFALKNLTGAVLQFTTYVSELNNYSSTIIGNVNENWVSVNPGELVPFSFTARGK